jgi:hypothetical protein
MKIQGIASTASHKDIIFCQPILVFRHIFCHGCNIRGPFKSLHDCIIQAIGVNMLKLSDHIYSSSVDFTIDPAVADKIIYLVEHSQQMAATLGTVHWNID